MPDLTPPQERAVRLALLLAQTRKQIRELEEENQRLRAATRRAEPYTLLPVDDPGEPADIDYDRYPELLHDAREGR